MTKKWAVQKAWDWQQKQDWIVGCNFIPSCCINGIEIWQEYNFETVLQTSRSELQLASQLGLNSIRMVLPYVVYKYQRDGFFKRLDQFLSEASAFGITLMPVLFDDCCGPKEPFREPPFGKQHEPVKGYHGGAVHTLFNEDTQVGYHLFDDEENWPELEKYVKDLVSFFKRDERILMWDIWNEPGNSKRVSKSLRPMRQVFEWVRELDPVQPLTAGAWGFEDGWLNAGLSKIESEAMNLSDIVTFHCYADLPRMKKIIEDLKLHGRPLAITEWLHRPFENTVQELLPLFQKERIGCYHWGLVNGKTQTHEPWGILRTIEGLDLSRWQHDLFHPDCTPYDEEEIELFKKLTGKTTPA